jgi:hypothetical protein
VPWPRGWSPPANPNHRRGHVPMTGYSAGEIAEWRDKGAFGMNGPAM